MQIIMDKNKKLIRQLGEIKIKF